MNYQAITNNKYATIVLWVSIGVVGVIFGNAIYKNIRKKNTSLGKDPKLDEEMRNLIIAIEKTPT